MKGALNRIERIDPAIRGFLRVVPEQALHQARAAETAIMRGDGLGPLHGLPIAVKDNLWTAGITTTGGSRLFEDFVPSDDCISVERIRGAGGIVVGKTHMPEFAAFPRSVNLLREECLNPWDTAHVTGASSGGSGAVVAAGMVPMSLGTDGGGSTRIPASLCGVFGLQPSRGVVPAWGRVGYVRFSGIGPMTRDVRDAARLLDVIAGPDPRDPASAGVPGVDYERGLDADLSATRIGWLDSFGELEADPEVVAIARGATQLLEGVGATIETPTARFERLWEMLAVLTTSAHSHEGTPPSFVQMPEVVEVANDPQRRHLLTPYIAEAVRAYVPFSDETYSEISRARSEAAQKLSALFERYDLLMSPTMPVVAPIAPDDPWANPFTSTEYYTSLTSLINVTGVAAASVPCGFLRGLPVGLQVIAPAGGELTVLRASRTLEKLRPWDGQKPQLAQPNVV